MWTTASQHEAPKNLVVQQRPLLSGKRKVGSCNDVDHFRDLEDGRTDIVARMPPSGRFHAVYARTFAQGTYKAAPLGTSAPPPNEGGNNRRHFSAEGIVARPPLNLFVAPASNTLQRSGSMVACWLRAASREPSNPTLGKARVRGASSGSVGSEGQRRLPSPYATEADTASGGGGFGSAQPSPHPRGRRSQSAGPRPAQNPLAGGDGPTAAAGPNGAAFDAGRRMSPFRRPAVADLLSFCGPTSARSDGVSKEGAVNGLTSRSSSARPVLSASSVAGRASTVVAVMTGVAPAPSLRPCRRVLGESPPFVPPPPPPRPSLTQRHPIADPQRSVVFGDAFGGSGGVPIAPGSCLYNYRLCSWVAPHHRSLRRDRSHEPGAGSAHPTAPVPTGSFATALLGGSGLLPTREETAPRAGRHRIVPAEPEPHGTGRRSATPNGGRAGQSQIADILAGDGYYVRSSSAPAVDRGGRGGSCGGSPAPVATRGAAPGAVAEGNRSIPRRVSNASTFRFSDM